jgi:hypothetical protein
VKVATKKKVINRGTRSGGVRTGRQNAILETDDTGTQNGKTAKVSAPLPKSRTRQNIPECSTPEPLADSAECSPEPEGSPLTDLASSALRLVPKKVYSGTPTSFRRSTRANKGRGGRAEQSAKIGEQIEYRKRSSSLINSDMASLLVPANQRNAGVS